MSAANDPAAVSAASEIPMEQAAEPAPQIKVIKGSPTDAELAALIGVLSAAGGGPAEPAIVEKNLWGHPVDRLRYQHHSWQRLTLVERTHLRK